MARSLYRRHFQKANYSHNVFTALYITAGICFTIGCIFFIYEDDLKLSARGLCTLGAALFVANGVHALSVHSGKEGKAWEKATDWFYIIGASMFLCANLSLTPLVSPAWSIIATPLFIGGSVLFVLGTFLNGAHASDVFAKHESKLDRPDKQKSVQMERVILLATAFLTMLGCLGYLIGSILFLPQSISGCDPDKAGKLGFWFFTVASFFFVLTGVFPLFVARREHDKSTSSSGMLSEALQA